MRSLRFTLPCLAVLGLFAPAAADEGMWMPQQIPALADRLNAYGFEGDPQTFADLTGQPMGAMVSLGGCSASFVSPDGLIVTNHHCVQSALQYNSTPERNLLVDGFVARTREDELSNGPGSRVSVTTQVVEVTDDSEAQADARTSPTGSATTSSIDGRRSAPRRARRTARAAASRRSSAASGGSRSSSSRSGTCAWSTLRPKGSATSAARPTTGAGPGTPGISRSIAPTSARTARRRPTRRRTSRTGPSAG